MLATKLSVWLLSKLTTIDHLSLLIVWIVRCSGSYAWNHIGYLEFTKFDRICITTLVQGNLSVLAVKNALGVSLFCLYFAAVV